MRRSIIVVAVVLGAVEAFAASGCSKDDAAKPMPPAAPIASSAPVGSKGGVELAIDPTSKTSIDMPAPKERIKATTTAAKGTVHFDPSDLTTTRGDVLIDLGTFTTSTFGDAEKDATQTKHARTWLQIDDMEKDPAVRERNRWVHFAIRSVDGLSATDLAKVAPTTVGGDDVRTVTLVAHGDIEVHSLPSKTPKDAPLEVKFHVPAGSPPGTKPTKVEIASKQPLTIELADHDIKPRDTEGILAQKAFDLLGTKVANEANVSVMLVASPGSS
jgi:hypothetical protein